MIAVQNIFRPRLALGLLVIISVGILPALGAAQQLSDSDWVQRCENLIKRSKNRCNAMLNGLRAKDERYRLMAENMERTQREQGTNEQGTTMQDAGGEEVEDISQAKKECEENRSAVAEACWDSWDKVKDKEAKSRISTATKKANQWFDPVVRGLAAEAGNVEAQAVRGGAAVSNAAQAAPQWRCRTRGLGGCPGGN